MSRGYKLETTVSLTLFAFEEDREDEWMDPDEIREKFEAELDIHLEHMADDLQEGLECESQLSVARTAARTIFFQLHPVEVEGSV
jgi:hypothetical protein